MVIIHFIHKKKKNCLLWVKSEVLHCAHEQKYMRMKLGC